MSDETDAGSLDLFVHQEQQSLFDAPPDWKATWKGMPEYEQKNLMPWQTIKVHFRNFRDRQEFAELVGQRLTDQTPYVWYPREERAVRNDKRWASRDYIAPRFPIYIISKGRWETRHTSKFFEEIGLEYRIVVEPQEYDNYATVIPPAKILVLPFSNLGQGSIPARNWVWEHSISEGAEYHWILDDNIRTFYRLHENQKFRIADGTIFKAAEDFTLRYENVALSGMNYQWFAKQKQMIPPFLLNTRIYSCILIKNDIPYRWRGRYNEDTDLSLRVLKDGLCTVQFNAFLADKLETMTVRGGNTDELYQGDGRLQMAQSLQQQHPDVVTITQKFGRWQHHVNYREFRKNKLKLKAGVSIDSSNDYGMEIVEIEQSEAEQ